jgi:hypothetical protein
MRIRQDQEHTKTLRTKYSAGKKGANLIDERKLTDHERRGAMF